MRRLKAHRGDSKLSEDDHPAILHEVLLHSHIHGVSHTVLGPPFSSRNEAETTPRYALKVYIPKRVLEVFERLFKCRCPKILSFER